MNLFRDSGYASEEERLPTLRQYLKSKENSTIPKFFFISLIWVPNKYPNYQIQTDKFRASIPKASPLGKALEESLDALIIKEQSIQTKVVVSDKKSPVLIFEPSKEKGSWETIGDDPILGYRFNNA